MPLLPQAALAAPLAYALDPVAIAPGVWMVYGRNEWITACNGGAIASIAALDMRDGAALIDAGPSHRYGLALKELAETRAEKPVCGAT